LDAFLGIGALVGEYAALLTSASSFAKAKVLDVLPLPQGQRWFGHFGQHLEARGGFTLYATLLADATFHDFLLACDQDLALQARQRGYRSEKPDRSSLTRLPSASR
jgi:hypothetical protein